MVHKQLSAVIQDNSTKIQLSLATLENGNTQVVLYMFSLSTGHAFSTKNTNPLTENNKLQDSSKSGSRRETELEVTVTFSAFPTDSFISTLAGNLRLLRNAFFW